MKINRGWLKELAFSNIPSIFSTLETFQPPMGWLKDFASLNILDISVTFETFHFSMG